MVAAVTHRGEVPAEVDVVVPVVDARRGQVFGCVYSRERAEGGPEGGTGHRGHPADGPGCEVWRCHGGPFAIAPAELAQRVLEETGCAEAERRLVVGHVALLAAADGGMRLSADVEAEYLVLGQSSIVGSDALECRDMTGLLFRALASGSRGSDCGPAGDPGTPEAVRPTYVRVPDADEHIKRMRDPWQA